MGKKKATKSTEKAKKRALLPAEGAEDAEANATVADDGGLRVNTAFARAFEARKRQEELSSLSRRRVSAGDYEDSEDSESETEDEDGEELTPELDADIRQTLRLIRRRDPAIYDPSVAFFKAEEGAEGEEEGGEKKARKARKDAPLYYKDLVRRQAEAGDVASGESDEEDAEEGRKPGVLTFREEQDALRKEFLASVGVEEGKEEDEDDEEEAEGGLFTVRRKSQGEKEQEAAEADQLRTTYGSKLKAEEDPDAFLEHYVSSEGWKDKTARVPHYEDIVREDEADAEALDEAESFEQAYNFRFEEEGGAAIQTHARGVGDSLRRVDDARKRKREERKARKAAERRRKEEELRRLKNLKQAEIQAKLDKVARLMGDRSGDGEETERLKALAEDLDADFDPEEYDKRMREVFDDEYYREGDDGAVDKPEWDDEEDKALFAGLPVEDEDQEEEVDEMEEDQEDQVEKEKDDEDEDDQDEEMEAVEEGQDEELADMSVEEMQLAKQRYLDELYGLDYEDLIGDLKCRFKYTRVRDNDFGLTVDEIMAADDKELRQLVALKRLAPFVEDEFRVDRKKLQRFRKTLALEQREREAAREAKAKRKLEAAGGLDAEAAECEDKPKKKRKRGKKKEKLVGEEKEEGEAAEEKEKQSKQAAGEGEGRKKRRGKKSKAEGKDAKALAATGLSTSRLESYKLLKCKS